MQTLITDSFKNWRQMGQSSGRRIKRSILIDANSIDFIGSEMRDELNKLPLLTNYLKEKSEELATYNTSESANSLKKTNIQRHLTNIGTFRAYCLEYLKNNPNVNSELTLIVRQLEPTEGGIPIEIWTYSATTNWIAYESIQSDIFDHLYSILHKFNLRAYQKPSGADINNIARSSQT
jgi:miniconductance mechanosensitive channel